MKLQQFSSLILTLASSAWAQGNSLICEIELADPQPSTYRCGTTESPENRRHLIQRSTMPATQHQCAKACYMNKRCASFTWAPEVGVCKTFNATAKHMKVRPSIDGRTKFWNKGCYTCTPRKFFLKASSPMSTRFENKYIKTRTDKTNQAHARFGDMAEDYFKMYQNGRITTGETGLKSIQYFDGSEGPGTNTYSSLMYFLTSEDAKKRNTEGQLVDVNCHIHKDSHAFTCGSDAGSTFFGCHDPVNSNHDARGLMLASSGATNKVLHSRNCAPITLTAEFLES